MTLADRLLHAMFLRRMTQKQLADAVGVKPPSVHGWLSAKSKFLRGENLLKAAAVLRVRQEWLATGEGPMELPADPEQAGHLPHRPDMTPVTGSATPPGYVRFQLLDGAAGMGDGVENQDYPEVIREVDIAGWEVRRKLGFMPKPGRIQLLTGRGPSMRPMIGDGDVCMVDTEVHEFDGDAVYVINVGGETLIKMLQMRGDGLYVVSANADYPAYKVDRAELFVGGRVVSVLGMKSV